MVESFSFRPRWCCTFWKCPKALCPISWETFPWASAHSWCTLILLTGIVYNCECTCMCWGICLIMCVKNKQVEEIRIDEPIFSSFFFSSRVWRKLITAWICWQTSPQLLLKPTLHGNKVHLHLFQRETVIWHKMFILTRNEPQPFLTWQRLPSHKDADHWKT